MLSGFGDNTGIHNKISDEKVQVNAQRRVSNGGSTIAGAMKNDVYSMFSDINSIGMSGAKKIMSKVNTPSK